MSEETKSGESKEKNNEEIKDNILGEIKKLEEMDIKAHKSTENTPTNYTPHTPRTGPSLPPNSYKRVLVLAAVLSCVLCE